MIKSEKVLLVIATLMVVIGLLTNPVFATPGATKANGCHTSKTEGYHCHKSGVTVTSKGGYIVGSGSSYSGHSHGGSNGLDLTVLFVIGGLIVGGWMISCSLDRSAQEITQKSKWAQADTVNKSSKVSSVRTKQVVVTREGDSMWVHHPKYHGEWHKEWIDFSYKKANGNKIQMAEGIGYLLNRKESTRSVSSIWTYDLPEQDGVYTVTATSLKKINKAPMFTFKTGAKITYCQIYIEDCK